MGKYVHGSDVEEVFPTDATLKRFKIPYHTYFSPHHINKHIDLVIYTGAHGGCKNVEVAAAIKQGIPVLAHGKALGLFMKGKKAISVAGSHGKTTTSAILAHILSNLNQNPSFAIGCGEILSLKTPAHAGSGNYFIAEADEYATDPAVDLTPRFLWQHPKCLVITNIDFDHPDVYKNIDEVKSAFVKFVNQVDTNGVVVINASDEHAASIIGQTKRRVVTFGDTGKVDYKLDNVTCTNSSTQFDVIWHNKRVMTATLSVPGRHNAFNALAVIVVLKELGFNYIEINKYLRSYTGTKRRFELIGERNQILLYDDYAHHPAEIKATLKGTRDWYPNKRIIVIFQPHTYSRTARLLLEFAGSFEDADIVLLTEIYASAREIADNSISGQILADATAGQHKRVVFTPQLSYVLKYLRTHARPSDLILCMGAGNIYTWLPQIFSSF